MKYIGGNIVIVLGGITLALLIGLLISWPVMWLWNVNLVPAVSGVHPITWMQAYGINVLASLLFSRPFRDAKKD